MVLLEGAYSCRPELRDLIDIAIRVDAPRAVRHARLKAREQAAFLSEWHARWDAVEAYYLTSVVPPSRFDLVVATH